MTKEEIKTWLLTHAGVESEYNRNLIYNTLKAEFSTASSKNFVKADVSRSYSGSIIKICDYCSQTEIEGHAKWCPEYDG